MSGVDVKASHYAGRKGVPAYFPKDTFETLTSLSGDSGARNLLLNANYEDLPGGELDVDTPDDLERVRALFA